jgi:hypothetical protein
LGSNGCGLGVPSPGVGSPVGVSVGSPLGVSVGWSVGVSLGWSVGVSVGVSLGVSSVTARAAPGWSACR